MYFSDAASIYCEPPYSNFLLLAQFVYSQPEENLMEMVSLATESLPSVMYHLSPEFISGCLLCCSLMWYHSLNLEFMLCHLYICFTSCKRQSANPNTVQDSKRLVLTLLSHPVESIRTQAYEKAEQIVKVLILCAFESPNEHCWLAGSPWRRTRHWTNFFCRFCNRFPRRSQNALSDHHVWHERLWAQSERQNFELNPTENDVFNKVVSLSSSILMHLLQSELLLPSSLWKQFLQSIIPLMAALQVSSLLEPWLVSIVSPTVAL